VLDYALSGSLSTLTYGEVNEQIDHRIRDNRRISTDKIAIEMNVK
jgi:hypothetical protein